MTQLSSKAIAEFQALWKKHYGTELPPEQAVVRAHQLFMLIRLLTTAPEQQVPAGIEQRAGIPKTSLDNSS